MNGYIIRMEKEYQFNYTYYVFKLIKQHNIQFYHYLLHWLDKNRDSNTLKNLFGKYNDPILHIVKINSLQYTNAELSDIDYLSRCRWNDFLYSFSIRSSEYSHDQLMKLNKLFWEDKLLYQAIKEKYK